MVLKWTWSAYYRVDWDFLDFTMARKEFGSSWRKRIKGCNSKARYSILVIGLWLGSFPPVEVFDRPTFIPISFTLVVDTLKLSAREKGRISGFQRIEIRSVGCVPPPMY